MSSNNIREIEQIIEQRIKASLDEGRPSRSQTVVIGNELKSLSVISLPVSFPIFNHNNHRLSAQIKDSDLHKKIFDNPYSDESQKLILELLSQTEEFEKLKDELKNLGQRDPGLINRNGILVNGNTRCAALRLLASEGVDKAKTIDVAVLPEGITEPDIADIEMELQMRKLTHQTYTFTNELIFMQSYKSSGKSNNELVSAMGWQKGKRGEAKVKKHMRVLGYIDEVKEINPAIKYKAFDSKKTHLLDLDEKMQSLINEGDEKGAVELKHQRLLGLFMALNKDHVREIDDDFFRKILNNLSETNKKVELLIKEHPVSDNVFDEDFDDLENQDNQSIIDSGALLKTYLTKTSKFTGDESGQFKNNDEAFDDLTTSMADACERSVNASRQESRNQELSDTMRGIRMDISVILEKLPERVDANGFKSGDFQFELNKAVKELERVQKEFDRHKKN